MSPTHPQHTNHRTPAEEAELQAVKRRLGARLEEAGTTWPGAPETRQRAESYVQDCLGEHAPELTAATATAEIAWVAREARALRGSDDEPRRARFFARKAALLDYIDQANGR